MSEGFSFVTKADPPLLVPAVSGLPDEGISAHRKVRRKCVARHVNVSRARRIHRNPFPKFADRSVSRPSQVSRIKQRGAGRTQLGNKRGSLRSDVCWWRARSGFV